MAHFVGKAATFYDKNYPDLIIIHVCDKMGLHPLVSLGRKSAIWVKNFFIYLNRLPRLAIVSQLYFWVNLNFSRRESTIDHSR